MKWLVLLALLPVSAWSQFVKPASPVSGVPIALRAIGYRIDPMQVGDWAMTISDSHGSAMLWVYSLENGYSTFGGEPTENRAELFRTYYLGQYLPKEKADAWRKKNAPDVRISSGLDGSLYVFGDMNGDCVEWDIAIQRFFKEVHALESQLLSDVSWTRNEKDRKKEPPLDESLVVNVLDRRDIPYLSRQWQWENKERALDSEGYLLRVGGQMVSLDADDSMIYIVANVKPEDVAKVSGQPWFTDSATNDGRNQIWLEIDNHQPIRIGDLKQRIWTFARHVSALH